MGACSVDRPITQHAASAVALVQVISLLTETAARTVMRLILSSGVELSTALKGVIDTPRNGSTPIPYGPDAKLDTVT